MSFHILLSRRVCLVWVGCCGGGSSANCVVSSLLRWGAASRCGCSSLLDQLHHSRTFRDVCRRACTQPIKEMSKCLAPVQALLFLRFHSFPHICPINGP